MRSSRARFAGVSAIGEGWRPTTNGGALVLGASPAAASPNSESLSAKTSAAAPSARLGGGIISRAGCPENHVVRHEVVGVAAATPQDVPVECGVDGVAPCGVQRRGADGPIAAEDEEHCVCLGRRRSARREGRKRMQLGSASSRPNSSTGKAHMRAKRLGARVGAAHARKTHGVRSGGAGHAATGGAAHLPLIRDTPRIHSHNRVPT